MQIMFLDWQRGHMQRIDIGQQLTIVFIIEESGHSFQN